MLTMRILTASVLLIAVLTVIIVLAAPATAENPVPFIDQPLVPDATAPGGAGFRLKVNGAGFVATSTVNWNGSPRTTTFVSSFQVTAAILASDIATASTAAVTVVSPSPGGGVSNTQYFSIAVAETSISFLPAVTHSSGGDDPVSVAVADLNGDGKLDLVVANCDPTGGGGCGFVRDGVVGVLLGNGDGTFQSVVTYASGGNLAASVAVADVNGDGKPDIIVAHECTFGGCEKNAGVSVLLGNGDGTFKPAVTYNSGGEQSTSVAVADVNGDGKLDLLVTNTCPSGGIACTEVGGVSVLLGNGDGTFQAPVSYGSGGIGPMSIAAADVNGDGKIDLVVANCGCAFGGFYNPGTVGVLLGNGDGTFQAAVSYSSGQNPWAIAVADVNGDGKPDLLVANSCWCGHDATVAVLLGNGDGAFQPAVTYDSGGEDPFSVAVADLNGDGKLDLIVGNHCANGDCNTDATTGILLGNGDGTFQPVVAFDPGQDWTNSVAVADVNGDGRLDLVFANGGGTGVSVLLNNTASTTSASTTTALVSSLNPSPVGQAITFTATVSSSAGAPPNGEIVTFYNGTAVLGTAPLSGGTASLTTSSLPVGTFTITASYAGDANFAASTSPGLRQVVNSTSKSATSTAISSSLNPSVYGQPITFTATLTSIGGIPTNGETVTFYNGLYVLGTAPMTKGIASLTISSLQSGIFTISAAYLGDANFTGSTSPVLQQVVDSKGQSPTTTALTSSLNPSIYGQKVTWTATVKTSGSTTPTGKVNFNWSSYSLGTATLNSSGVATLTLSGLSADAYPLFAEYTGDTNNGPSASPILNQVIKQTTSAATITASPNPSTQGQSVTFTAKITSPTATPAGPVTFTAGKTVLGSVELSDGKATFTTSTLAVGSTTVTVTYPWDSDISSSSASVTQVVQQ
jgi:hypothetical protein